MKKYASYIKDTLILIAILSLSFFISGFLRDVFDVRENVTSVFIFAVFLISFLTQGYVYGIIGAFAATILVNYAFTFPYFELNFTIKENLLSGIVMIVLSILTSALTTKIKLHEAIKAESDKERTRANLLRAVSHDLRTPLTTIYGSATTLLEDSDTMTPTQKEKIVVGIKEDSQWLIRMVENLLSITRIDSGKVKIIKTPTVLEELVDSVLLKFKKRYPSQAVEVDIPDELVVIPMDAILIEQVLTNLLENAVQHASDMKILKLRVFVLGEKAIFEIKDDGCGIAPEYLDKIFDGYNIFKDVPADSQKKNAGIGLSVCSTIVKAHGGDIKAENSKSGGAVFRFTLDTESVEDDK